MKSSASPPVMIDESFHQDHREHAAAIERLATLAAHSDTGGAHVAAQLLLGLYNGPEYPFDLTELCRLDHDVLKDAFFAIEFRVREQIEPHELFVDGGRLFEYIANSWEIRPKSSFTQES